MGAGSVLERRGGGEQTTLLPWRRGAREGGDDFGWAVVLVGVGRQAKWAKLGPKRQAGLADWWAAKETSG
jgi:hypothetical protein